METNYSKNARTTDMSYNHQKSDSIPPNGYNLGDIKEFEDKMSVLSSQGETNVDGDCSMKGIKSEDSMNGSIEASNSAYQEPKQK